MDKEQMIGRFIGEKKIKHVDEIEEKTTGGMPIYQITFKDGTIERFSSLMLDKVVTDKMTSLSELRDLRVIPVVAVLLQVLRDWGMKMSELPYLSTVLNQSLDYNHKQALSCLLADWMPKPKDPEEADLIAIDLILRRLNNAPKQ